LAAQLASEAMRAKEEAEAMKRKEEELWAKAKAAGRAGDAEIDSKLQQMQLEISQRTAVTKQEE
jgi:hypothetical protein